MGVTNISINIRLVILDSSDYICRMSISYIVPYLSRTKYKSCSTEN